MPTSLQDIARSKNRKKRLFAMLLFVVSIIAGLYLDQSTITAPTVDAPPASNLPKVSVTDYDLLGKYQTALAALDSLEVKGRAPKTNYKRTQFSDGWEKTGSCDVRNKILARDMSSVQFQGETCMVLSGILQDPYTGKTINFTRGSKTSSQVQIDHVVALSDAWQKGAQQLTPDIRHSLANDGLNLLAVDGPANMAKSDGDAATWLPSNKPIRCAYIARQISVKLVYSLWVTSAEKNAMNKILTKCPNEPLAIIV